MIVVYLFIFLFMLFASGAMLVWFFAAAGAVAAAAPLVWNHLGEYQKMRILVVLDETLDPLGYGWQAARCKLAIGGGKIFGQGLFNGTQTQHGILPAKETDCIFAVAGEELGMIGCIVIILLLLTIIIRCFYVASRARNGMGSLICVGIASMLIFQTLENIGMCLGVTPVIGITLPFSSYGGTSIVTMYVAMGIISSIKMRQLPDWLRSSEEYY
jgi:rod shape determining protein RodA